MAELKLRVRAAGMALVVNYEALDAGARRFVGRTFDSSLGPAGGWPADDEPHEVPNREEYRKALRDGSLEAADQATADLAGVKFSAVSAATKTNDHDT